MLKIKNVLAIILLLCIYTTEAQYKETIKHVEIEKNLVKDFQISDNEPNLNQSIKLQSAIDKVSAQGGGRLILPKGIYNFDQIYLNSNVHLLIDKDVVIRPYPDLEQNNFNVFNFNSKLKGGFIENVSIRCLQDNEYFTIDYSHVPRTIKKITNEHSARAMTFKKVRNFLVEGVYVKDNWTRFCAASFLPEKFKKGYNARLKVFKPINGIIRNFKSTNSNPGFGLVQLHAGNNLHFENLSTTNGGVTFRLETGAGGFYGGVDQITAENIYCENGKTAMLMAPHTARNGLVKVKNIKAVSCSTALEMAAGFDDVKAHNSNKPGNFAKGCTIENVHAVFGENTRIQFKAVGRISEEYLPTIHFDKNSMTPVGPSYVPVLDRTGDSWTPIIKNVTSEGFKEGHDGILKLDKEKRVNYQVLLKEYPIWNQIPEFYKGEVKSVYKGKSKKSKKDKKSH